MSILKKYIGILYQFLKIHRIKCLVFILLSVVFILLRFPYEEAVLYLISQLKEETRASIHLKYDSFYINPIGPSFVFNNPKILITKNQNTFTAQRLIIRPSYTSLLQLQPGVALVLKWPGSIMNATIRKKQIKKNKPGWFIKLTAHNFNPALLDSIVPTLSKTKGKINMDMELLLDPVFETQPEGFWNINGNNIHNQALSYTFPGAIGTVSLPSFKWSKVSSRGQIKEGEIVISDISIGGQKDAFQIKSRGVISIDFIKSNLSGKIKKPLIKSYSMGLDILTSEDLKPKLYFLNLVFSSIESKTPQGWRYLGYVKGNTANFFNLSPAPQLPTLEEIQNPKVNDNQIF